MVKIGDILVWASPIAVLDKESKEGLLYRVQEGDIIFHIQSSTQCQDYTLNRIEGFIKDGLCYINVPTYEIY